MKTSRELNDLMKKYPAKFYLGTVGNERIYLYVPSWECDWYWGFGYLGNRNCHYHLNGIGKYENINFHDAMLKHFGESLVLKDTALWQFCEIVLTIYTLKEAAEVLGRGGSHMTMNPDKQLLCVPDTVAHINQVLIPAQIASMYKILIGEN